METVIVWSFILTSVVGILSQLLELQYEHRKVPSDYEPQCNTIWKKGNWPRLHFSASQWHIVQCPHLKSPWKCSCPEGWLFWRSALRQNWSNYQLISNLHAFMRHVHKTLPSSVIPLFLLSHQFSPSLHFIWKRHETTSVVSYILFRVMFKHMMVEFAFSFVKVQFINVNYTVCSWSFIVYDMIISSSLAQISIGMMITILMWNIKSNWWQVEN